jgi:two-component system, sensor histidine kinase
MKPLIMNLAQRYGFALFLTMLATLGRQGMQGVLDDRVPFGLYFLSVILTAWIAGTGPAILALAGGIVAAAHWFILPEDSWLVSNAHDQMSLGVYGVVGIVAIALFDRLAKETVLQQQRNLENERLSQRLREADSQKDQFLALLAHELRNPLAPIRSGLTVIEREKTLSPAGREVRQVLRRQLDQLVRIVDDLFDVSRFLRGQMRMERQRLDLRSVVDLALHTVEPMIEQQHHDLQFLRPPDPVWVMGDELRLTQAVANLLTNAARYTPRGGRIRILLDEVDDQARLKVSDNGIGISAEGQTRIFDVFIQENPTQTRDHGGLGLGLAIVRQIVELHAGDVSVHSAGPGCGSCFVITLDRLADRVDEAGLAEPAGRDRRTGTPHSSRRRTSRRVLIVDDNCDAAQTLGMLLSYDGYATHVVCDGHMALETFGDFDPDVVLLDIGMPGMDGYEVARRLRARRDAHRVKIIAITGWGQESDRQLSMQAGFDHHVVKPVDIDDLLALLADVDTREESWSAIEEETKVT